MTIKGGVVGHVVTAGLFGLLNVLIGWLFFLLLGVVTGGLVFAFVTRLVVTAIMLKITSAFSSKLELRCFSTPFVAALIMSVVSGLSEHLLRMLRVG